MSADLFSCKCLSLLSWGSSTNTALLFSWIFYKWIGFINNNCKTRKSLSVFWYVVGTCVGACFDSVTINCNKILILRNNPLGCPLYPKSSSRMLCLTYSSYASRPSSNVNYFFFFWPLSYLPFNHPVPFPPKPTELGTPSSPLWHADCYIIIGHIPSHPTWDSTGQSH